MKRPPAPDATPQDAPTNGAPSSQRGEAVARSGRSGRGSATALAALRAMEQKRMRLRLREDTDRPAGD